MNWLPPIYSRKKMGKAESIFFALKEAILSGRIPAGEKLPSTREIARYYGVDKSTILEAIKILKTFGLVETTLGSGVTVSPVFPTLPFSTSIDIIERAEQREEISKEEDLKFYFLMPDKKLFPYEKLKKILEEIIEEEKENLFEYKDPMGYLPLRDWISKRLNTKPEEIMIVNGAQQGLSILCQLFLTNQSRVLCENPTYPGIIPLLKIYNTEVSTIPVKQNGICISTLKHYLSSPFKFLYLQPSNQNPTGITLSEKSRMEIIRSLPKHQICLIEDSAEPIFNGKKTLYQLDPLKRIIHIGSFSKAFIPGFRIGWMCGPEELIRKAIYLKALQDLQTPLLLQILIYRFINSRDFANYLKKMKKSLKLKADFLKDIIKYNFPDIKINLPEDAQNIWFPLPEGFSSKFVEGKLKEKGIKVAGGDKFFFQGSSKSFIRIAHLNCSFEELKTLFSNLKEILKEVPGKKEHKITLII